MSTIPKHAEAMLRIWPDDLAGIPGEAQSGTCIETSKVAHLVLARFGVRTKVMATDLWIGNRIARDYREVPLDEWPPDAWSVGTQSGTGPLAGKEASKAEPFRKTGFNGHVILVGEDWIADMTAQQFDRPRHGIDVKGAIVLGGLPGLLEKKQSYEVQVNVPGGALAVYRTRPEIASFRQTGAWRADGEQTRRVVNIISDGIFRVLEATEGTDAAIQ